MNLESRILLATLLVVIAALALMAFLTGASPR